MFSLHYYGWNPLNDAIYNVGQVALLIGYTVVFGHMYVSWEQQYAANAATTEKLEKTPPK